MIVWMDDLANFGRKIACTDCGLEDLLTECEMMTMRSFELKHDCKKLFGKSESEVG